MTQRYKKPSESFGFSEKLYVLCYMKKLKTLSVYSFMGLFPDEASALIYVEKTLWGDLPICPRCKGTNSIKRPLRKGHFCRKCRKDFTVKVGNVFENSNIGLHKWLYAMYLFVTSRKGIPSLQLSKEIGITQKSAWFLLQRIRESCKQSMQLMDGIVEIDETYIGGREKSRHEAKKIPNSQGGANKDIVMGFKERDGKVKAYIIPNVKHETLKFMIDANITKESTICTDELKGYYNMDNYTHLKVNHSAKEFVNGMASVNGVESFWALLKRGYHGTYHNFSTKHLNRYVDEFVFRQNEGNCKNDTVDRIKSLCMLSKGKYLSYKSLINKKILDEPNA